MRWCLKTSMTSVPMVSCAIPAVGVLRGTGFVCELAAVFVDNNEGVCPRCRAGRRVEAVCSCSRGLTIHACGDGAGWSEHLYPRVRPGPVQDDACAAVWQGGGCCGARAQQRLESAGGIFCPLPEWLMKSKPGAAQLKLTALWPQRSERKWGRAESSECVDGGSSPPGSDGITSTSAVGCRLRL